MPKALFVDGHSLAYRAFFALPDTLATAEGVPTNAVLGFAQMLLRILDEERPDYLAVAFDKGKPTFRIEEFADYKAQRKPTPDALRPQIPLIKEFVRALRAPVVEVEGYEGDDILAALADLASAAGVESLILTGDRDTLQLVGPGIRAIITLKGISETAVFDSAAVKERYGVEPANLPDLKGLVGDPSDNLPGVPGIGPKTAAALLERWGTIDNLLAHLDEVTPERARRALADHADDARLCRNLATIRHEVPFEAELKLEEFRYQGWDAQRLAEFLRRLELRALLRRLGLAEKAAAAGTLFPDEPPAGTVPSADAAPIATAIAGQASPARPAGLVRGRRVAHCRAELAELASRLARASRLAMAVNLDGERPLEATLDGVAIAADGAGLAETIYIPVSASAPSDRNPSHDLFHRPVTAGSGTGPVGLDEPNGLAFTDFAEVLGPILAAAEPAKVMHCAKPFRVWLEAKGRAVGAELTLRGLALDTELGAYLLDPSRFNYGLESLAREFARQDILLPGDQPRERLSLEADITLAVADPMRSELSDKDLDELYDTVELPLAEVLSAMERTGVGVNLPALREMSQELGRRTEELAAEIYAAAGEEFNINSPKQLGDILFGKLKLPHGRKTATGAYSTSAEVLEELGAEHDIVAAILEHRQLVKLKGTYTDGMAALVDPVTGRLHTVFKQTVTATGRLSSAEPNLQNIPVRDELGRRIRRVFVPAEGYTLLAADYSQIELRVMAHLSGDPAFVEAFRQGQDIHQRTASEVFGVPMDSVTSEMRSRAKAVNFGIIYGQTDYGLSRGIGVPREEAAAFIESYFARYAGVREWVERNLTEARTRGYVSTLFNRRRYLPELHSANRVKRQFAERAARNTPIQGTAADIIKLAMVRIFREMRDLELLSRMTLQVHDELVFEVTEAELATVTALVRDRMEQVMSLDVPLRVDLKLGPNWYEMEKFAFSTR